MIISRWSRRCGDIDGTLESLGADISSTLKGAMVRVDRANASITRPYSLYGIVDQYECEPSKYTSFAKSGAL